MCFIKKLDVRIEITPKWGGENDTEITCPNDIAIAQKVNEIIDVLNQQEKEKGE